MENRVLTSLTAFVNALLDGKCHREFAQILCGGRLLAMEKKTGGIRQIVVGYVRRRLTAKCASAHATESLRDYFSPLQVGVGVAGGCEAVVHAARRFLSAMPADNIIVKLDFSFFISLHRDYMLEHVGEVTPELYTFGHLACNEQFGEFCLTPQEGSQQGDPLEGLLFCLAIHPILRSTTSPLTIGFMDDVTLGGTRKEGL